MGGPAVASSNEEIELVAREVMEEVKRAISLHSKHNSHHELYSVLLEEMDEFWEQVKKKRAERDTDRMREELVQIAAVAIRGVLEQFPRGMAEIA